METLFVTSLLTYDEVGERFNVSGGSVRVRAHRQGWNEKREKYREKLPPLKPDVIQKQTEKERETILTKIRFDALVERCTDVAVAFIARELTARYQEGARSIDAMEMKDLMGAVEKAQGIKYRSLGIPPPKQVVEFTRIDAPAAQFAEGIADAMDEYEQLSALAIARGRDGNGKKPLKTL